MRIVDHPTFIGLPAGTLFQRYRTTLNFGSLEIKASGPDTYEGRDFDSLHLDDPWPTDKAFDAAETMDPIQMQLHLDEGKSVALDLTGIGRDGGFDASMRYAIWERDDVIAFKACIAELPVPEAPQVSDYG